MAQDSESAAAAQHVLETTEATAQPAEIAIAPVALPPEPTAEGAVEVPQLKENPPHLSPSKSHQKVTAHDDEHVAQTEKGSPTELEPGPESQDKEHIAFSKKVHGFVGEEEGDGQVEVEGEEEGEVEGKVEGEVESLESQKMKLERDRKKSRKEAMNKRFSVGLHSAMPSEMDDREEAEEEEKVESSSFNFENFEDEGDKEETKRLDEIFNMDSKYDISISASILSTPSAKSMELDTIQLKEDFLRYFDMPTLSDMSEEHEPETISLAAQSVTGITQDKGQFMNPLTDDLSSSSTSSEHDSLLGFEDQDDTFDIANLQSGSEISDIPDIPSDDAPRKITFQDIAKDFATIEGVEEDADEAAKRVALVGTMVREFVDYLVTKIVTAYESRMSDNKLRSKCDKVKLVAELRTIVDTYIFEKYTNEMLSTRLAEYYKRSRNSRVFARLDDEKEHQYYERYNQALAKVDHLKLCLDAVKHKHAALMVKVNLDLESAQFCGSNTESKLERKIQKLLVRPDSDFLKRYVDWALRQMNAKRNEISDMRLGLISKMNTLGQLQAKLQELETLSSTVSIQDFLSIQNDVINLEKKVEERNLDLNKMRTQYLMEVHITHHNKEKAHALADKLKHKKATLANAIGKQRSLRANLYNLKLDRTKIREKRKELTFQGGILAMPSLMYEYDHTVMQIKASQERVVKLRETVKSLARRISIAEGAGRSI